MSENTKIICIGIVFIPIGIILRAYALSKLWAWFIVTAFPLPHLSFIQCAGVSLVISFTTRHLTQAKDGRDSNDILGQSVAHAITIPALTLLTGWIIRLFL